MGCLGPGCCGCLVQLLAAVGCAAGAIALLAALF